MGRVQGVDLVSKLVIKLHLMNSDNNSVCLLGSTRIPPCPGSFSCDNRTCVNMSQVCNGVPDCPRGDDELVCGEFSGEIVRREVRMEGRMDGVKRWSKGLQKVFKE